MHIRTSITLTLYIVSICMVLSMWSLRTGVRGINLKFRRNLLNNYIAQTETTSQKFTSISFYRFINIDDSQLISLVNETKSVLVELGVKGTVLLSTEGFNAQLAVPEVHLKSIQSQLKIASNELYDDLQMNLGQTIDYSESDTTFPFKKLVVRKKKSILTDGLCLALDWNAPGPEMSPKEWHNSLVDYSRDNSIDGKSSNIKIGSHIKPIVIDCRNKYESDMGTFKGATPLNTTTFRESWPVLEELLRDTPKDTPVLTYCTGGIRCVKVNAFLQQRLGFTNTHRLQGGIVAYERWLRTQPTSVSYVRNNINDSENVDNIPSETVSYPSKTSTKDSGINLQNLFMGKNFIFDRRRLSGNRI